MGQVLAEVHDLVSYSGRKGSAMTLLAVFYALVDKIRGRQWYVIWRDSEPYICNTESEESGEVPTSD